MVTLSETLLNNTLRPSLANSFPSLLHPPLSFPLVSALLDDYADVFAKPKSLPLPRAFDHKIPLKPHSEPTSQRPYRFPYVQKDVVENLVQEMLSAGLIQDCHNPFPAPILLVKKKDDSWLYVDYRKLNDITIKDKFHIPVIDELLDEFHGSIFFSKIDLRSGYFHIRVYGPDIPKTAFGTHQGDYEFRVMPFGLTNAPTTFQALMNDIFRPYLRKFILDFFDDILIYSKTLEENLLHLSVTLSLLRQHSLYAKISKCCFAQT